LWRWAGTVARYVERVYADETEQHVIHCWLQQTAMHSMAEHGVGWCNVQHRDGLPQDDPAPCMLMSITSCHWRWAAEYRSRLVPVVCCCVHCQREINWLDTVLVCRCCRCCMCSYPVLLASCCCSDCEQVTDSVAEQEHRLQACCFHAAKLSPWCLFRDVRLHVL
jgi:hypothetical protein